MAGVFGKFAAVVRQTKWSRVYTVLNGHSIFITLYNKGSNLLSTEVHLHSSKCQPQSMILHSTVFTTQTCQALAYISIVTKVYFIQEESALLFLP